MRLLTTLLILSILSCASRSYHGNIDLRVNAQRSFETKLNVQQALTQWASCGYASSLPDEIRIIEDDLNTDNKPGDSITCAKAVVGGATIILDRKECKDIELDVVGHEVLHLIGFTHLDDFEYCNFNKILAACGFDISHSGPKNCRNF